MHSLDIGNWSFQMYRKILAKNVDHKINVLKDTKYFRPTHHKLFHFPYLCNRQNLIFNALTTNARRESVKYIASGRIPYEYTNK